MHMEPSLHEYAEVVRRECAARRARVLAHPDIAARLCDPPMRYTRPEVWTGFIPPNEIPTISGWKRNESPIRKQLIAICKAVETRENELPEGGG